MNIPRSATVGTPGQLVWIELGMVQRSIRPYFERAVKDILKNMHEDEPSY